MKQSKYDNDAFLTIPLSVFAVTVVLVFAFWYVGAFDGFSAFLEDMFDIILDGDALGDWIAGVLIGGVVGILKGLWDFGIDVGLGASDMLP